MSNTLAEQAYLALRERMSAGELPPGTRLVSRALADELGFSFTPVREALTRLASEGLVEHVPGAGASVRSLDRRELAQLYDLRATLEPHAASEAARHISRLELDDLRRACAELRSIAQRLRSSKRKMATAQQRRAWARAEERFHVCLIESARNPWLTKVAVELRIVSLVFTSHRASHSLLDAELAQLTCRDHERLVELLEAREADSAADWMKAHLQRGRDHVLEYLFGPVEHSGGRREE